MNSAEGVARMLREMWDLWGVKITDEQIRDLVESGQKVLERERKAKRTRDKQ